MSVVLAIEASQRAASVAIAVDDGEPRVEHLRAGARHDDDLLAAIDRLVRDAGCSPRDVQVVGVSLGPGGFTGLRIATTTAQFLGEVLGCRLVGVPTAEIVAAAHAGPGPIVVALASKRETVWAVRFNRHDDAWHPTAPGRLVTADELAIEGVTVLLGDQWLPESIAARCAQCGVPISEPTLDASVCLQLTRRRAASGQLTDVLEMRPIYPRPPEAVSLWEQRDQ